MKPFRLAILALTVGLGSLAAQTIDTGILGSVSDPSGAAIVGAEVVISDPATGVQHQLQTSETGAYDLRYLRPGSYVVEVRAEGFRSVRRPGVVLQLGQQARVDLTLELGAVTEVVEVTSASPLLQTESAVLGGVVDSNRIVNLPLNGRNFAQLSALNPGVSVLTQFNGLFSRVSANGARDIAQQVSIDGVSVVNNRQNFVAMFPSLDAMQEFKVQTGNYTAEYGGNAGANIQLQLKSGTNEFHGVLFEFFRNDDLDARGYFRPEPLQKDQLRQNQFGGVLSGPIQRNKTFFMASFEGLRSIQERPSSGIVLTPEMRRGDFSAVSPAITDPLGGDPFPNRMIPAERLNPVSVNLVNQYMPLPNQSGSINYAGFNTERADQDQILARVDHQLGSKDQISGHFIYQDRRFPTTGFNPNFVLDQTFENQSYSFQWVHTFSSTIVNELRVGHQRGDRIQLSALRKTDFQIEDLGINGFLIGGPDGRPPVGEERGFPLLNIQGFMSIGDSIGGAPTDKSRTYQIVDNLAWIRGKHALKIGGDIRRLFDDGNSSNDYGVLGFTRDISGNAASAYMLGFPRSVDSAEGLPITGAQQWRVGMYLQDDWRVTPNLTLNLGLRYDFDPAPVDTSGNSRTLRFDLDPSGPILWPEPGETEKLWKDNFYKVAPRFGFAYRLRPDMTVRGGYGIFFTAAHFDNLNVLQANPPTAPVITITNPTLNPIATIQNPFPRELVPLNPIFNVVSIEQDRRHWDGYLQNWNFQVGKQFGSSDMVEVGYVGSKGTKLDTSLQNFNNPSPGTGAIQPRRPFPQYGRIRMLASDGNSLYHSLQARYERRLNKGLSATLAYTWSHMIDDTGQSANRGACQCQDARNRGQAERADSLADVRQRLVASWLWELPSPFSNPATRAVLGDWALGAIMTFQDGSPFNVTQNGDSLNIDFGNWVRPNLSGSAAAELPGSERDPVRWFNTAAFTRTTQTFGTTPRNPLVGPGMANVDFTVSKQFRLPWEDQSVLFRAEFFNFFNTPQFANPGGVLGTGAFGRITGTRAANRQIQFALKYYF